MTADNQDAQPASPEATYQDVREQLGQHLAVRSFVGCEKSRNEDFGTVAEVTIDGTTYSILVISDGVSTSRRSHIAARAACIAGRDAILSELRAGNKDLESCLRTAVNAAQKAVLSVSASDSPATSGRRKRPPQAVFMAAIAGGGRAALVWLGDCRAYLLPRGGGARLLTKDHSWINLLVETEGISVLEAMERPEAHWITRCLGKLKDDSDIDPSYTSVDLSRGKLLLLCSDGFWNYGHPRQDQRATPMLDQMHSLAADAEAASIATRLVDFACASGGHDNITVAVLKL